jgi:hypothetical protein
LPTRLREYQKSLLIKKDARRWAFSMGLDPDLLYRTGDAMEGADGSDQEVCAPFELEIS